MSSISLLLDYLKRERKLTLEQHLALKERITYADAPSRKVEIPTPGQLKIIRGYLYRLRHHAKRNGEVGVKFDFLMLTGSRVATANACQVKHINFARRTILLTHLKGRAGRPTEKEVPVVDELLEILERYVKVHNLQPDDYLFTTENNNHAFQAAARAAGIGRWFHHACRKWFATRTLISTRDPAAVSDLLCQSNPRTLFEAYRQVCAEHLEGTVRNLKLFPGATADSSLGAAEARAQEAVTKFVRLEKYRAAVLLDHLLWLESEVDQGHYETIALLPGLRLNNPTICPRGARSPVRRPTPTLLKTNLRHLIQNKGVYHSDIAFETGIPKSTIARACAFGTLQASLLPALSKYFGVTLDDLVTRDLTCPDQTQDSSRPESLPLQDIGIPAPEAPLIPPQAPTSVLEVIQNQPPDALAETVIRNLRSLLLERNLTVVQLSEKSGLTISAVTRYLCGQYLPREQSVTKIAQALGISGTEIFDQHRDNIVVNPRLVRSNLEAILACRSLPSGTYAGQLNISDDAINVILETGEISPSQAHKIANKEGVSVRQLVSEDISATFPPAPPIDAAIAARNIRTLCWERGLHPAGMAKKAGVDPGTVKNYCKSQIQHPDRGVLTKIAEAMGLTLAEIVDPARPVLQVTPFFRTNLDYLLRCSGRSAVTISKRCGLHYTQIGELLSADEPNPVQISRLARHFSLTPRQLLMEDLSRGDSLSAGANRTGAESCENPPREAIAQPA